MFSRTLKRDFIKELKELLAKAEVPNSSKGVGAVHSCAINNFLQKKLADKNKKLYAKLIYKYMDAILSHCRENSLEWLKDPLLQKQKGYAEKIYQFVINYGERRKISRLFTVDLAQIIVFNVEVMNLFNSERFIDDLIELNLEESIYCDILKALNCKTQKAFIDRLIEEQISLPRYEGITDYAECENYIRSRCMDLVKFTKSCFDLRRFCKRHTEELNAYFELHPNVVFNTIRAKVKEALTHSENQKIDKDVLDVVEMIINEIMKSDDTSVSELDSNSTGYYSFVITTNTKAIKVGYKRRTVQFPDNPYIVTPLIRRDISSTNTPCFIEVTEKVKLVNPDEISEEELYKLYKGLRDLGIIWTDIKAENVGRLLKENVVYWDKAIAHEPENLSLKKRKGDIVLKAGDLVVLDADYMFEEGTKLDIPFGSITREKRFNKRYERELEHKDDGIISAKEIDNNVSKKI